MKIIAKPSATAVTAPQTAKPSIKMKTVKSSPMPLVEASGEAPIAPISPVAESTTATEGHAPNNKIAAPEATEALSPQYVALARREKQLRRQAEELKAKEAAWNAQQQGYLSREALKADPIKALNDAGISLEQLVSGPTTQQIDPIQAKIDALEAKISGFDKSQTERQQAEYQQALQVIEGDVNLLVSSDPAFETIKATNSSKEVVRLIEKVFETEGVILGVEEAAQMIEEKLLDRTVNQVKQLSQLKKIQERMTPPPSPEQKQLTAKPAGKTLTNAMGVTRQLTARERAILAFNRQLK